MAKYINQLRYYGDGHSKNSSPDINYTKLRSGSIFSNTLPITQLGIQTLPGVKVYINNHTNPIIIGQTGIYELNVDGLSNITDIKFDGESLNLINNSTNAYLIIDYIYEKEG